MGQIQNKNKWIKIYSGHRYVCMYVLSRSLALAICVCLLLTGGIVMLTSPRTILSLHYALHASWKREKRDRNIILFNISRESARFSLSLHPFLAFGCLVVFSLPAMVGAAASSSYASPLCTFFVAACMSVSHNDTRQAFGRSRRRRQQLGKCSASSGSGSIQALLVSSFLDFKPCNHYNNKSKGNAFACLFGSSSLSLNRKQRKTNRATSIITFFSINF